MKASGTFSFESFRIRIIENLNQMTFGLRFETKHETKFKNICLDLKIAAFNELVKIFHVQILLVEIAIDKYLHQV